MLNRNFFLGALLALSVSFLVAFSNAKTESNAVYEYVAITQTNYGVLVSEQGKEIEQMKIKISAPENYNPTYELLNKYEAEGWELFTNNAFVNSSNSTSRNYFLLRRKKQ